MGGVRENEVALLNFLFKGKFADIGICDDKFIYACSVLKNCTEHGYELDQFATELPKEKIC